MLKRLKNLKLGWNDGLHVNMLDIPYRSIANVGPLATQILGTCCKSIDDNKCDEKQGLVVLVKKPQ